MNGTEENQLSLKNAQNVIVHIGIKLKKCSKCEEIKTLDKYYSSKQQKSGYSSCCKKCYSLIRKKRRSKNTDKYKKASLLWRNNNRERAIKTNREWRKNNKEKHKIATKKWREKNKEKVKETRRNWIENNRKKTREYSAKKRLKVSKRISNSISSSILLSIKKNKSGMSWEKLVNFSFEEFKKRFEKLFADGMSWDNYGRNGWHVDHIIPISAFNFEKPEDDDFKRCWALSNLQPMWAKENISKGNKLKKPFQPRLIF